MTVADARLLIADEPRSTGSSVRLIRIETTATPPWCGPSDRGFQRHPRVRASIDKLIDIHEQCCH